jgi:hypothetical protein
MKAQRKHSDEDDEEEKSGVYGGQQEHLKDHLVMLQKRPPFLPGREAL